MSGFCDTDRMKAGADAKTNPRSIISGGFNFGCHQLRTAVGEKCWMRITLLGRGYHLAHWNHCSFRISLRRGYITIVC